MQQVFGVFVVVTQHVAPVPLRGSRARALMEDRLHRFREVRTRRHACKEVVLVEIVEDVAVGDVGELGAVFEIVHHQHVAASALVQRLDQIAADKSRPAGHDNHRALFPFAPPCIFSMMRVVE